MIAVDTSSLIAYLSGQTGADVDVVDEVFKEQRAVFPPVVLSEILSDSKLSPEVKLLLLGIPLLTLSEGYWERTGILRSKILSKGQKARLADALIAQSCIDHSVTLITRDHDFRHFVSAGELKLLP